MEVLSPDIEAASGEKLRKLKKKKKKLDKSANPASYRGQLLLGSLYPGENSHHRIPKTWDQSGRAKKNPGNKLALSRNSSIPAGRCYKASALITNPNPRWKKLISEHSSFKS